MFFFGYLLKVYNIFNYLFFIGDYRCNLAVAEGAEATTLSRKVSPASPALSGNISCSAAMHKPSLRSLDTGAFLKFYYNGFFFGMLTWRYSSHI